MTFGFLGFAYTNYIICKKRWSFLFFSYLEVMRSISLQLPSSAKWTEAVRTEEVSPVAWLLVFWLEKSFTKPRRLQFPLPSMSMP